MAFLTLNFPSWALGHETEVYVILPNTDRKEKPCRNLYLLHGLSDDNTVWMRRTSIERYADKYSIAVIMPNGGKSFYTDMLYGEAYYTYISKELPQKMSEYFGLSTERENNYIAGNSMGGYGALKTALRENDRFAAVAGLSSATDMSVKRFEDVMIPVFGDGLNVREEDDLFLLAANKKDSPTKPEIFMGIGTEDFLYEENQRFLTVLKENGYSVTYRESVGNHCWDFWDEYIQYALDWMFSEKDGNQE